MDAMTARNSDLMTTREAAEYLKLNQMTVYKLARQGRIPASKIGGAWRFRQDLLESWMEKQARTTEGAVLIIDDDPGVRDMISEVISRRGYKVTAVESGEQAIEEMDKQSFDLVFLDLVLPGMSGTEAFSAIKERDGRAVVVIITGHGDEPIAMDAMRQGPLFLIRKPFRVSDIVQVLGSLSR